MTWCTICYVLVCLTFVNHLHIELGGMQFCSAVLFLLCGLNDYKVSFDFDYSPERSVEVVFMEDLQPKSHSSDGETKSSDLPLHENTGTWVKKNACSYSGLMCQILKYWAPTEGCLFEEGLESALRLSVCRQQLSMIEVPCRFGAGIPQMEFSIWSELVVSSMLKSPDGF